MKLGSSTNSTVRQRTTANVVWAWGWQSAKASSKRTAAGSGPRTGPAAARSFASRCRSTGRRPRLRQNYQRWQAGGILARNQCETMKRRNHPAYWQLDVLVCVMIALAVLIVSAHLAPRWQVLVDAGWA